MPTQMTKSQLIEKSRKTTSWSKEMSRRLETMVTVGHKELKKKGYFCSWICEIRSHQEARH